MAGTGSGTREKRQSIDILLAIAASAGCRSPAPLPTSSMIRWLLSWTYIVVLVLVVLLGLAGDAHQVLCAAKSDLERFGAYCQIVMKTGTLLKVLVFVSRGSAVRALYGVVSELVPRGGRLRCRHPHQDCDDDEESGDTFRILLFAYLASLLGTSVVVLTQQDVLEYLGLEEQRDSDSPVFLNSYPLFKTIQVSSQFIASAQLGSTDLFLVWFFLSAADMYAVLAQMITDLSFQVDSDRDASATSNDRRHQIRDCIQYHQRVLRACTVMDKTLSILSLITIMADLLFYSMSLLRMVTSSPDSVVFFASASVIVCTLLESWLYCWAGDSLSEKSLWTFLAVQQCNWYNAQMEDVKLLQIVASQAARPALLMVWKFGFLGKQSFLAIIQKSYSFYATMSSAK